MKMLWPAVAAILLVAGASCSPVEVPAPATELMPPKVEGPRLPMDLVPPPPPEEEKRAKRVPATLFLINVYGVKNSTAEDSNDVLHNDVIEEVPEEIAEPLAMFLLIVEDEDESKPASLDEVAKDLEEEGFKIEKITKDGETRLIKVDLGSVETLVRGLGDAQEEAATTTEVAVAEEEEEATGKLAKFRRKRSACLKCKLEQLRMKKYGGGGGCGGGCGGGGGGYYPQPQPVYQPVQVIPVVVPSGGGYHKKPYGGGGGGYYPQPQTCNTCGGGGGGYGHGGGNSYAQASAQASASAQGYGGGY